MNKPYDRLKQSSVIKNILLFAGFAVFMYFFYGSAPYRVIRGEAQKALLWTGLYDAKQTEISKISGPALSENDYDFALASSESETIPFDQFKGKVLFINKWASWCIPCAAEMPGIQELYEETSHAKNLKFVLITMDEQRDRATRFMQDEGYTMPYYFPSTASDLPSVFRDQGIPTTYVVSDEGQLVYHHNGMADYSTDAFKNWLLELAGE